MGESNVGGRDSFPLIIGYDFDMIVLPYTNTAGIQNVSSRFEWRHNLADEYVVPRSIPIAFRDDIVEKSPGGLRMIGKESYRHTDHTLVRFPWADLPSDG